MPRRDSPPIYIYTVSDAVKVQIRETNYVPDAVYGLFLALNVSKKRLGSMHLVSAETPSYAYPLPQGVLEYPTEIPNEGLWKYVNESVSKEGVLVTLGDDMYLYDTRRGALSKVSVVTVRQYGPWLAYQIYGEDGTAFLGIYHIPSGITVATAFDAILSQVGIAEDDKSYKIVAVGMGAVREFDEENAVWNTTYEPTLFYIEVSKEQRRVVNAQAIVLTESGPVYRFHFPVGAYVPIESLEVLRTGITLLSLYVYDADRVQNALSSGEKFEVTPDVTEEVALSNKYLMPLGVYPYKDNLILLYPAVFDVFASEVLGGALPAVVFGIDANYSIPSVQTSFSRVASLNYDCYNKLLSLSLESALSYGFATNNILKNNSYYSTVVQSMNKVNTYGLALKNGEQTIYLGVLKTDDGKVKDVPAVVDASKYMAVSLYTAYQNLQGVVLLVYRYPDLKLQAIVLYAPNRLLDSEFLYRVYTETAVVGNKLYVPKYEGGYYEIEITFPITEEEANFVDLIPKGVSSRVSEDVVNIQGYAKGIKFVQFTVVADTAKETIVDLVEYASNLVSALKDIECKLELNLKIEIEAPKLNKIPVVPAKPVGQLTATSSVEDPVFLKYGGLVGTTVSARYKIILEGKPEEGFIQ